MQHTIAAVLLVVLVYSIIAAFYGLRGVLVAIAFLVRWLPKIVLAAITLAMIWFTLVLLFSL
jgi:hypothetical protein